MTRKPTAPTLREAIPIAAKLCANLRHTSLTAYEASWRAFIKDHSPTVSVLWPTRHRALAWVNAMAAKGRLPSTIHSRVAAMRTLYDILAEANVVTGENPFKFRKGKLPKIPLRVPRTITRADFEALLVQVAPRQPWYRPCLAVLGYAGLRCEEARNLRVGDVNMARGTITVIGKGNKERVVPMAPALSAILAEYLPTLDGEFLFPSPVKDRPIARLGEVPKGPRPISRAAITRLVDTACKALSVTAEGSKVTPHTFRKFTTQLIAEANGSIVDMQQILGHATVETTTRYFRPTDAHLAGVMARVAQPSTTPKEGTGHAS